MNRRATAFAAAAAAVLAMAGVTAVLAQAQASRTLLSAIDVDGTNREAHLGTADIPKGARIARHTHPGQELALVTKGRILVKVAGRPDAVMKVGDSYVVPRGVVHEVDSMDGDARIVSTWVVDKGAPLATPAP